MNEAKFVSMIKDIRSNILAEIQKLEKLSSLNGLAPKLHWRNKMVYEVGDTIFKIESPAEAYKRAYLAQIMNGEVEGVFVTPEIISSLSDDFFVVTREEKVDANLALDGEPGQLEMFFKKVLGEEKAALLNTVLQKYGVLPISPFNFGLQDGALKIFDWISDTHSDFDSAKGAWLLKNGMGEVLYDPTNR